MVATATPALAATAPGAPTLNSAIPGNNQVTLNFTPPSDGGSPITDYIASFSPPASSTFDCAVTASPCVVTGLTNSTTYTLSIAAKNVIGTGPSSGTATATPPGVSQTITFPALSNQAFNQTPQALHATTTATGLSVTYTSATTSVCTVTSPGVMTFLTAGTCTIKADQAGNGTYLPAAQKQQSFTITAVAPGPPTNLLGTAGVGSASLAFTPPTTANSGGDPITGYHVTISPGGTTVACASSPCSLTGLTNGTAYTFTMTATSVAGTGLGSAPSNVTRPNAIPQTITFNQPTTPQNFGATPTLAATATPSGLTVTFTSITPSVCTITSAGALTTVSVGTCTIRADQDGNSTYASATPVEHDIVIQKATPTVAVSSTANPAVYGQPLTFTATLTNPVTTTGNVQFNIDSVDVGSPVAMGAGGTASYSPSTPLAIGTHTIKATYAGDANHNTANATMTSAQTINKADTVTTVVVSGDTITATVSAASPATGTPTGGVAFTVGGVSAGSATLTNGVATITGSNVGNQGVGASYGGDSNFNTSTGHRAPIGPTVKTHVTSAHAKHRGWYRSPVTVSFTCTPNTAPLSSGCPSSVTRSHNGAGQSVRRTVRATDGGSTTVTVSPINIDRVKPTLVVKRKGGSRLVCHAHDALSHGATCSVRHRTTTVNGVRTVHWRAVAHDRAGNKRVKKGSFTI